ncbi:hypothetical protein LCGC14_0878070 [marine sediment metagenome]|uniref:Uncharacterized protein n=1 Tax=marine sediment metagenome TaxID=412755 RepID=A0A0F9P2N7_9ZZZZ
MKIRLLRYIGSLAIVIGVYNEAGFFTGLFALLTLISIEIITEHLKIINKVLMDL